MSPIHARAGRRKGEAEHEARQLLRCLADGGALRRHSSGAFVLCNGPGPRPAKGKGEVPASLVERCVAQDWLERRGGEILLSEAGRAWLRRAASTGDAFREQHQLRTTEDKQIDGTRRAVLVNEAESPLGWLKSRKDRNGRPLIADDQYQAGERLRADYWFAQLSPRVTANGSALAPTDRSRRSAPRDPAAFSDDVIAAKERVSRALKAVGPELAGVLIDVCCELKGPEDAEKAQGWLQRVGKVVLQIALTRLARHYGLLGAEEMGEPRSRRVRHWGSEDYRPTLDSWNDQ
jgi:hypothetical protein